jgi:hypothetical protein
MYGALIVILTLIGSAVPALAQSQQPGNGYLPAQSSAARPQQPQTSSRTTTERQLPRTIKPEAAQPATATDSKF